MRANHRVNRSAQQRSCWVPGARLRVSLAIVLLRQSEKRSNHE